MKWFAVMTAPRVEERVNRDLKRLGYWTFFPFVRVRRLRKRANVDAHVVEWITTPYFPGYLFVCLRDNQGLYGVNECEGVSTVIYSGGQPLEIPHQVMDELMMRADGTGQVGAVDRVSRAKYKPGTMVRFADNSPMSGLIAQIALDNGKEIKLWVEMLGGRRQLAVDPSAVAEIAS